MPPTEFPTEPVVQFSAEKREDGSFFCSGTNVPFLYIVVHPTHSDRGMPYYGFIKIARDHLKRNGMTVGEHILCTPWEEVELIGNGRLEFR